MNCFPCFSSQKSMNESNSKKDHEFSFHPQPHPQPTAHENKEAPTVIPADYETSSSIKTFNFRELLSATKNFRQEFLLGEGGLGKVYKGTLQGKEVAVKQLDRNAMEGNNEFFVEVGQLSLLQHSNLVSLIGYCNDGDQRLLVYEFMSGGSLEDHLYGTKAGEKPLDWVTRMKIASGAAEGLQYLHEKAKPAILYRDLKSSKILLDDQFNPKLSNVGLDKLASSADSKMPMQSSMMDDHGYNAPEYTNSGTISTMTDVYSFGVVLLELITGRKALDSSKPRDQQSLVAWAQPIFKEPKHFPDMADPLLKKQFPERGLNQVVAIAAMCVQEEAAARPLISDLASVLSSLSIAKEDSIPATLPPSISSKLNSISEKLQFLDGNDQSGSTLNVIDEDEDESDDKDDEGSTSGSSDEETDQPNNGNGNGNRNHSLSQKSSGRSSFSMNNDSGRAANSMSHKKSKKSASYSSCDNEDGDGSELAAASSNRDLSADAAASSNTKTNKKSADESGDDTSQKGANDSLGGKTSKKSSEKTKSRKIRKKKKTKDEASKSSGKKSNDEAAMKKKRRKPKKRSDNGDDLVRESQPEN